jgi:hypothetical protein
MKFYDYPDNWQALKKSGLNEAFDIKDRNEMYRWFSGQNNPIAYRHMMFDMMWHRDGRPYYDVYPCIIPMLIKLNLNFPGNVVSRINSTIGVDENNTYLSPRALEAMPEGQPDWSLVTRKIGPHNQAEELDKMLATNTMRFTNLLVRLPETDHGLHYEDPKHGHTPIRTIFLSFQPVNKEIGSNQVTLGLIVGIDIGETDETGMIPMHTMKIFPLDERPIEESLNILPKHETTDEGMQIPEDLMIKCVRLGITLCLLEDNPDLIEPDVLSKDRHRVKDADEELLQRLIDKARRKGKYGFVVGKSMEQSIERGEMSPHSRRPHPALVWTGEGRTVPKVVMRKGSLIHGKKVTNVPTGYKDDEPDQA